MIKQPSRAGNNYFDTLPQTPGLVQLADTSIDNDTAQIGACRHFDEVFVNLFGKFAGRGDYQSPDTLSRSLQKPLQCWQDKSCCLTGACLGQAEKIATLKNGRHGLLLYGGWCSVTAELNCGFEVGMERKNFKTH